MTDIQKKKAPVRGKRSAGAEAPRSSRLLRPQRADTISKAARELFAEHGFAGQTRELAARAGVTQAVLYRHFPNKDAIIEKVYHDVFQSNRNPEWENWIGDRSVPLRERLIRFYKDYAKYILNYEWIRLFLYFGLDGRGDFAKRYLKNMHQTIWYRIVAEVRHDSGRPSLDFEAIKISEVEMVWALIAGIFFIGVRNYVLGLKVPEDIDLIVEAEVSAFLDGVPSAMAAFSSREASFDNLPDV